MNGYPARPGTWSGTMSPRDFAAWGVEDVAYIRLAEVEGRRAWTIFAANGTPIGAAESREVAEAAARQHDLEPLSVH